MAILKAPACLLQAVRVYVRKRGELTQSVGLSAHGRAMLTANIFLLLAAYYLLKPVREAPILSESGAQVKSYSAAAQALLLLAIVPFYDWFATEINRSRLFNRRTLANTGRSCPGSRDAAALTRRSKY